MIKIYCNKKHVSDEEFCQECREMIQYSNMRIDKCPYMETKTFCSHCKTHCYNEEHKDRIKKIMRFSGPRLIFHHPIMTIKHMIPSNFSLINIIFVFLGFISLGLGVIGIALPILPTTPFLLLSSYFFVKGSPKLEKWFKSTKLYEKRLKEFDTNRSMSLESKITLSILSSTMLLIAFIKLSALPLKILIIFIDLFKYYFFIFKIKTRKVEKDIKVSNRDRN